MLLMPCPSSRWMRGRRHSRLRRSTAEPAPVRYTNRPKRTAACRHPCAPPFGGEHIHSRRHMAGHNLHIDPSAADSTWSPAKSTLRPAPVAKPAVWPPSPDKIPDRIACRPPSLAPTTARRPAACSWDGRWRVARCRKRRCATEGWRVCCSPVKCLQECGPKPQSQLLP